MQTILTDYLRMTNIFYVAVEKGGVEPPLMVGITLPVARLLVFLLQVRAHI